MCRTRPQTGCPWPSAASWDSSLPFPASVFSKVSLLITGGTQAEVKAACALVSCVPSSFSGALRALLSVCNVPRRKAGVAVPCVTQSVSSQVKNRSRPCCKGSEQPGGDRAARGEGLVTGLHVNMCHPWVMGNGHSSLNSTKTFWGNFAGHRFEPSTNCTQANLSLNGTGLGLPGGFSIITAAVPSSGTVILIYMIYGNAVCNDSSIYKQD